MQAALGFGVTIVGITVLFIMAYANAYVRKNRTKELGLYTILGLEKRHLHLLSALEIFYFAKRVTKKIPTSLSLLCYDIIWKEGFCSISQRNNNKISQYSTKLPNLLFVLCLPYGTMVVNFS